VLRQGYDLASGFQSLTISKQFSTFREGQSSELVVYIYLRNSTVVSIV
jgi:hypothetical protein